MQTSPPLDFHSLRLALRPVVMALGAYEVYRFGGHELGEGSATALGAFFRSLFVRYGVDIPAPVPDRKPT